MREKRKKVQKKERKRKEKRKKKEKSYAETSGLFGDCRIPRLFVMS